MPCWFSRTPQIPRCCGWILQLWGQSVHCMVLFDCGVQKDAVWCIMVLFDGGVVY